MKTEPLMADAPTEPRGRFISKSKFLWGLQCPKLLWHAYNAKHLIPEAGAQQQAVFDQGHEVGKRAKKLFPGGIEIGKGIDDFDEILAASKTGRQATPPAVRSRVRIQWRLRPRGHPESGG